MADTAERELERAVLAAPGDAVALSRLKAAWARSLTWRECEREGCRAHVPELAWDRHQRVHECRDSMEATVRGAQSRMVRIGAADVMVGTPIEIVPNEPFRVEITAPSPAQPRETRARIEPLWHKLVIPAGMTSAPVRFFRNFHEGHTNLMGVGGSRPAANHFYLYGLSLLPDHDALAEDVRRIWTDSSVSFLRGGEVGQGPTLIHGNYPGAMLASEVMADPDDEAFSDLAPRLILTLSGRPIEIHALECFEIRLHLNLSRPLTSPVGITAVMHGVRLQGMTW